MSGASLVRQMRDALPGARMLAPIAELWADHRRAVAEFVELASAIPDEQWSVPRAEGKWTPAQEVAHIALSYATFARDLAGGTPMRMKGTWWQRRLWRLAAFSTVMRDGRLPGGVRAPREVRPPEETASRYELLMTLHENVALFELLWQRALTERPRRRVTHAYFGLLSLEEGLRLCAVHARNHARHLQTIRSRA